MNYDVMNYAIWAGPVIGLIGLGIVLWVGHELDRRDR